MRIVQESGFQVSYVAYMWSDQSLHYTATQKISNRNKLVIEFHSVTNLIDRNTSKLYLRLMLYLAALAKSADNVHTIWQHIEAQQLLGGQGGKPGITEELEEIETRAEEFPLTRAFIQVR